MVLNLVMTLFVVLAGIGVAVALPALGRGRAHLTATRRHWARAEDQLYLQAVAHLWYQRGRRGEDLIEAICRYSGTTPDQARRAALQLAADPLISPS